MYPVELNPKLVTYSDREAQLADASEVLDLISECAHIVTLLEQDGKRAVSRLGSGNAPAWDAYPTSSLPESSIARGRVSNPVANAVIRHAGGKDADGEGNDKDDETTADTWRERDDPIGRAVRVMHREAVDAVNRLASAQQASHAAQGLSGGQVFGYIDKPLEPPPWATVIGMLRQGITALTGSSGDLPRSRANLSEERKAGLNNMHRELSDAKNRLRTAERAMREVTPTVTPDPCREVCKGCGTSRDVVTWFGQKPRQWISGEASCRECVERPKRVAKGRAS